MITEGQAEGLGQAGATGTDPAAPAANAAGGLDAGSYEVLRDRLTAQATELAHRAEALNARRIEVFGRAGLRLLGTERLRTEHPVAPRDIAAVDGQLLFGYTSPSAVRTETAVPDVFTLRTLRHNSNSVGIEEAGSEALPGWLEEPAFHREFTDLHRYYRDATLARLRLVDGKLLAVFRTGAQPGDLRALRWQLTAEGTPRYLDALGERDHVFPPSHAFVWTPATREDHVLGRHPHVSVEGEVFVSTVGGALTLKTEDTTESAEGIYHEPVDEPLQSLADADIEHAKVGPLLVLRVRPYNETAWRHLVFNTATRSVVRLDGIGQACLRLPEEQGIIFPGGYCLATGTVKTFDTDTEGFQFERFVRSPNGEDVLYAFHHRTDSRILLLSYNLVRKEVANPVTGHGFALFDDGTLVVLRADSAEPARLHTLQVWQSPYAADTCVAAQPVGTGPLERIGNADLVRAISECLSVARSVTETLQATATSGLFATIAATCTRLSDRFSWLADPDLGNLHAPLAAVRTTAEQVLLEFESVQTLTRQAADALAEAAARTASLVRRLSSEAPRTAAAWVAQLAELRKTQGQLLTLREMRYANLERIDTLATAFADDITATAKRAVAFLQQPDAFSDYHGDIEELTALAQSIVTVAQAAPVAGRLDGQSDGLRILTEVVTGLDIADATVRTAILERIAEALGGVNRARAMLAARRHELLDQEGRAAFAAEFTLLDQAVSGALAVADTPEACADQLTRLMVQLENLEARFAESEDFLAELAAQRTHIYEAFSSRKQTLQDARARHAERLADSATRILDTIHRRATALDDIDAVHAYFASDPMVAKVRRTLEELRGLGEQVRADELDGQLRAARLEAGRALRDRTELYADQGGTLRLGAHRFTVNTQPVDLTLVPHDGRLAFALTGTDYRAPINDPDFQATRPYWEQSLPSESSEVYRAEHLAAQILATHGPAALRDTDLAALVRRTAQAAYDEGYVRGVHDQDATAILTALLDLYLDADLLRYPPATRAAAQLLWAHGTAPEARQDWTRRALSLARAKETFGPTAAIDAFQAELAAVFGHFGGAPDSSLAAEYLFQELTHSPAGFVTGAPARALVEKFRRTTDGSSYQEDLAATVSLAARRQLIEAWLGSYAAASGADIASGDLAEAVVAELCPDLPRYDSPARLTAELDGLLGSHPRITGRRLTFRIDEFLTRTGTFRERTVPGFRAFQQQRNALVARERARLRVEEFRPKVMNTFVRNRLIDEVYLPLIGGNFAKQLGTTGDARRSTGNHGLLLLISPPGYGKTTLMEYLADRLGLLFVNVGGPALGPTVSSLDPGEAPNATARREVEKINFALQAGNNTLLYLDDIQHASPELLQKFISLCDTQRVVEGVWDGEPRTYDLRGKRFAVCMAGNPYTESGRRFRIPDMLANRADIWNLGDVLTGKDEVFAFSFIENALTSNPILAPLAARDRADLELLVRLAGGDSAARGDLTHPYSPAELHHILAVLRHLLAARDTVLAVNAAYLASAAQTDNTRTEPPFQLQGSYRSMNKIAERIVPVMDDAELAAVIDDHYTSEARTLTSSAEANLLKLAELRGTLTPAQAARWSEVKAAYVRTQALGGADNDPLTRAVAALGLLADRVAAVETAINRVTDRYQRSAVPPRHEAAVRNQLSRAVPDA